MEDSHKERIKEGIRSYKEGGNSGNLIIPLIRNGSMIGHMEPVTWLDAENQDSITLLADWRRKANVMFPSQFLVTHSGTHRWLIKQLLEVSDRLLFWVKSTDGTRIGHIGFARFDFQERSAELDNAIRGVSGTTPGIMNLAYRTLPGWAFQRFELNVIYGRVLSDNARVLSICEKVGFREMMRMPLARMEEGEIVRWVEVDGNYRQPVSRYYVTLRVLPEEWLAARQLDEAA